MQGNLRRFWPFFAKSSAVVAPSPKAGGPAKSGAKDFFNEQRARLEEKSPFRRVQLGSTALVESYSFQGFMLLNLFFVIFLLDLCVILNIPSTFDEWAYGFLYFAFVAFTLEMVLRELSNPKYFITSFFVMDFIGTIAVLIDIPFFQETIFGIDTDSTEDYKSSSLFKTSRATRLGSRAGQILKVVRLLRVVRIARVLRLIVKVGRHRFDTSRSHSILAIKEESGTKETTTLAIGERLNDIIAQRVAALVMISIFVVPLLIYETPDTSKEVFLLHFDLLSEEESIDNATAHELGQSFFSFFSVNGLDIPLNLSVTAGDTDYIFDWRTPAVVPVRDDSYYTLSVGNATAVFNTYPRDLYMSWLDVTLVLFVVTVLTFFSGTLASSCKTLVVDPLNNMLRVVHKNTAELVNAFNSTEKLETEVLSNIISKMTKVVVAKGAEGEKSKVQAFMNDNQMDETTRRFLAVNYTKVRMAQRRNNAAGSLVKQATKHFMKLRTRSAMEKAAPVQMRLFDTWTYNVFDYAIPELREHVKTLMNFMYLQLKLDGPPPEPVLSKFVQEIEKRYMHKENPYHSFFHGVDVMWTCYRYLTVTDADAFISKEEQLALILAAYGHDVGHLGVTNKFLIDTSHALALRYNDKAVQEHYHSASLFETLANHNVLEGFDPDKYKIMRLVMVETILATDMTAHFKMVSDAHLLAELGEDPQMSFMTEGEDNLQRAQYLSGDHERLEVMKMFLHSADLSNPTKPSRVSRVWTDRVMQEFFEQGDEEKRLGLPVSPFFDRETTIIPQTQFNFISFIVWPLFKELFSSFPSLSILGESLLNNQKEWLDLFLQHESCTPETAERMKSQYHKCVQDFSPFLPYVEDSRKK